MTNDKLVGCIFHILDDRHVKHVGIIEAALENGYYLVNYYTQKHREARHLSGMKGWRFYRTNKDCRLDFPGEWEWLAIQERRYYTIRYMLARACAKADGVDL